MPGVNYAFDYFTGQGYSPSAAAGISAGLFAESHLNPTAVNPTSGAYGIGQWLGARKAQLFSMFGPNPTLDQQLSFVNTELPSNGGATISAASTPQSALSSFIGLFERPGPGTAGDIARGTNALTQISGGGTGAGTAAPNDWLATIANNSPDWLKNAMIGAIGVEAMVTGNNQTVMGHTVTPGAAADAAASTVGITDALHTFNNTISKVFSADTWQRVAFVSLAVVLLVGALIMLAKPSTIQLSPA